MNPHRHIILLSLLMPALTVTAQRDTTKKQTIEIVSSFKPVLRNAVKINLSGSQLPADTSRNVRPYQVPAQNLFYAYQPIALKALALEQDTALYLGDRNYVKAGFGSYTTPYLNAGLSFGDGRQALLNLYGNYISSKGKIKNQDYSILSVKGNGSYFTNGNEIYASAEISRRQYYLYGYDHSIYDFKKDQIRQQFQEVDVVAGFRNTRKNMLGIHYNPSVRLNFFTNKSLLSETTFAAVLPAEKSFGDKVAFKVEARFDFTNYATKNLTINNFNFSNNLIQVAPSLIYNSGEGMVLNAGIIPVWDNGNLIHMPNIFGEFQLKDKTFMLQAGWVGRVQKNTFRNLSVVNPYIAPMRNQNNTRETELYGGIKATIGKHFNFSAKAGYLRYRNFQFFLNDTAALADGKSFIVSNDRSVNNFRLHADVSYINQDKFTLTGGVTFNGFTGMQDHARAWHTIPMEFNGSLRWWAFEKLLVKSDCYVFGAGKYLQKGGGVGSFGGGSDLSAGAEYRINKQFSAFLDVNNIFDNRYERWHNYPVYGINLLGGIIVRF